MRLQESVKKMSIWVVFAIYVLISVTGLTLIKMGTADAGFGISDGVFNIQISAKLLIGIFIYLCSFLLSLYVMSQMNLSIFYPAGAGAILVATTLSGYFFLKEHIGMPQLIGIILILFGIVVMNIKR